MSVYVDDAQHQFGRMIMCHMLADEETELHQMANMIGVSRRHFQGDHYDICKAKRVKAVGYGAVEITQREAVTVRKRFLGGQP